MVAGPRARTLLPFNDIRNSNACRQGRENSQECAVHYELLLLAYRKLPSVHTVCQ